ncbi:MAG TPA: ATP-binding cassette domain-containing protein [Candidatus Dormibacteraeota bacterium]|nr:ATP-binding cassette domain-containing protein [Candidatus Dormibacteraeota bacterium]
MHPENLRLQGQLHQMSGATLGRSVDSLIERFGLQDVADKISKTYSGGTQRKLDVAMGLVHQPEVLFLDEPTTGLDPEARAEMWREISHLARNEASRSCSPPSTWRRPIVSPTRWRSWTREPSWHKAPPSNSSRTASCAPASTLVPVPCRRSCKPSIRLSFEWPPPVSSALSGRRLYEPYRAHIHVH